MGTHYCGSSGETAALNAYIKFTRAFDTVHTRLARHLASLGLTMSQLGVLEVLLHLGPMCQRQVSDKLLMSRANITTVVDNLERNGHVKREAFEGDRRMIRLVLTEKGENLIRTVFPQHVEEIEQALSPLSEVELAEFAALCKKLGVASASGDSLAPLLAEPEALTDS